ncbi:hypothetical protein [Marinomonas posidonica]|uniref:hypothetical protein n=1 Tax=Marinomonas posidonica TaxID=936476 RepID=UPI0037354914
MISIGINGIDVDQEPNCCPVCNHLVSPKRTNVVKEIFTDNPINKRFSRFLEILYECPSVKCGHLFLSHFERKSNGVSTKGYYTFTHATPNNFKPRKFDERISKISPDFIEIFNQSSNAENSGLSHVCGMGYRKALEFLIKDYCVSLYSDSSEKIMKMRLMNCIDKYITDINIKECATRAVWLGNDETHYQRKWQDKDISDLKLLIDLVIHWVVSDLMTQEYMQSMQRS